MKEYSRRESIYIPIYIQSYFCLRCKLRSMLIANAATKTSNKYGQKIINDLQFKEDELDSNFRKLCLPDIIGYLYIINQQGTNLYKIGYTSIDPIKRLSMLQVGNPHLLRLEYYSKYNYVKALEKTIHIIFKKNLFRGEWFVFDKLEMCNITNSLDYNPTKIEDHVI